MSSPAQVTVLLAIRNGGTELEPQLDSYLDQTLKPACILASDDGSTDDSRAVFTRFAERARAAGVTCQLFDGPQRGPTANFLSLLARPGPDSTHVALSDQDDIWLPGKLEDAVARLSPHTGTPTLVGTRSWEWDPDSDRRQLSRPVPEPHDFRHALVQNYAGGNTMVLNRAGIDLVQSALPRIQDAAVHDWWLYQMVSGAGGTVLLGETPHILYRQHHRNQIGANTGLESKLRRFNAMLHGTYRSWNDLNVAALMATRDLLTPEARQILTRFAEARQGPLHKRLAMLHATGLHRKGHVNQATLWLAAMLGKI